MCPNYDKDEIDEEENGEGAEVAEDKGSEDGSSIIGQVIFNERSDFLKSWTWFWLSFAL